ACGIAGAFLDHGDVTRAHLISMWVAPAHRRLGIASSLVKAITGWAHMHRVGTLRLLVTSSNTPAIKLYERLGFKMTGWTAPHPNDPSLSDCEMSRVIT
ncbi:MAG: GNAT family N-acetyltransferase, partial [Candidatus Binatia bacterium]